MSLDIRNCHIPWSGNKSYSFFTRTPMLFIHIRQRDSTLFWTLKQIKNRIFVIQLRVWTGPYTSLESGFKTMRFRSADA